MKDNIKNSLRLLLIAIIWGFAFAFQSMGGESLRPFTFFAFRNYFAVATMLLFFIFIRKDDDTSDNVYSIKLGIICGIVDCVAAIFQQFAIVNTSAANTSFITAMYVIIVPIIDFLLGSKVDSKIWLCVGLELVGLYLLCIDGTFVINIGDALAVCAAILFAVHIIIIDRGGRKLDSILFCFVQFIVCAVVSTLCMLAFEMPIQLSNVKDALIPLLYTGALSSAFCITVQVSVQKEVDPTIASLIMCLESVFGAIGGYLILHETLSTKELIGCAIMFIAIVLSQLFNKKKS